MIFYERILGILKNYKRMISMLYNFIIKRLFLKERHPNLEITWLTLLCKIKLSYDRLKIILA